jgi:putative PepSY-like beta-lactamase-inhibitor
VKISSGLIRVFMCVSVALVLGISGAAQEVKVSAKKVPRAVIAAFKAAYPGATIRGYAREKENGKVYFEIESTEGDVTRDVLYNPDGTLAVVEESMPVNDLPQEVQDAMRTSYPKAVIISAEKISRDGVTEYEAHAKVGRKHIEVKFDASGKVLKVE